MDSFIGIDIGVSSLKAAPVDPLSGRLLGGIRSMPTPRPLARAQLVTAIADLARSFGRASAIGIGFPCVVQKGRIITSDNLHRETAGIDTPMLTRATGLPVVLLNDAEAAARAEMQFGAGRGRTEKTLVLTFGTGIGSAVAHDGVVIPCEFGGLPLHGDRAERYASAACRSIDHLTWAEWGARVGEFLELVEGIAWPELIIIGGGVAAQHDRFFQQLHSRAELVPAALRNNAGIVGAAILATGLLSGNQSSFGGLP
ncbi:MAG: ROK family protein [Opitutaceae bacterium]|nr:ROK family protein [Opitutaceae bacterium]